MLQISQEKEYACSKFIESTSYVVMLQHMAEPYRDIHIYIYMNLEDVDQGHASLVF